MCLLNANGSPETKVGGSAASARRPIERRALALLGPGSPFRRHPCVRECAERRCCTGRAAWPMKSHGFRAAVANRSLRYPKIKERGRWWPGTELNCRHYDFQSYALPTELPGRSVAGNRAREFTTISNITHWTRLRGKSPRANSHERSQADSERFHAPNSSGELRQLRESKPLRKKVGRTRSVADR